MQPFEILELRGEHHEKESEHAFCNAFVSGHGVYRLQSSAGRKAGKNRGAYQSDLKRGGTLHFLCAAVCGLSLIHI